MPPSLSIQNLTFSYGSEPILKDISLDLQPGQITALCGANGAGKSTLIKILSGVIPADAYAGCLAWPPLPGGEEKGEGILRFSSPRDAQAAGIISIPQDASLFPDLSVAENLVLEGSGGSKILNQLEIFEKAAEILRRFGSVIPLGAGLGSLPLAQRQSVAILRALAKGGELLLLDEPTAALPRAEAERLLELCRKAASEGRVVVYVSHHLDEVFSVADRIVVLRNGEVSLDARPKDTDKGAVITGMLGHAALGLQPTLSLPSPLRERASLSLKSWALVSNSGKGWAPSFDLDLKPGEVVGLSGLAGSGKDDLIPSILGIHPLDPGSKLTVADREIPEATPTALLERGLVLVPGDRARDGIYPELSVARHLLGQVQVGLGAWAPVRSSEEFETAESLKERFGVKAASLLLPITSLSGGNQQKVLLARAAATGAQVFFLDGPTRGVDVGARADIYQWIRTLASEGKAFLIASDDLDELSLLCDRVLCFKDRRVQAELSGAGLKTSSLAEAL